MTRCDYGDSPGLILPLNWGFFISWKEKAEVIILLQLTFLNNMHMKTRGRPIMPNELKRQRINATISPETKQLLDKQPQSQGVVIDLAIESYVKELMKGK